MTDSNFVGVDEDGVIHLISDMAWHIDRGNCDARLGSGSDRMIRPCTDCWTKVHDDDEIEMSLTPIEALLILGYRVGGQS